MNIEHRQAPDPASHAAVAGGGVAPPATVRGVAALGEGCPLGLAGPDHAEGSYLPCGLAARARPRRVSA